MPVYYLPCYDNRGNKTGEVRAAGGRPCPPLADAVLSNGTLVQHKTVPANPWGGTWSSQGQNDARKFTRGDMIQAARTVLQERVRQLVEEFEETHRATVTELHLARSLRLSHVLDGDYNERTNYVTAEVVPWP